ncbi:MAG TPA: nicotinate (nicotinamide) nucleotide adenylyltransferase [Rikenellaceae bacterium]|nr:nicotinate (nicotinamide) nucleotide adenylyltransferase [Rikenellaceae bacterium]HCZ22528.1 nicotinate (nicotinamide) nucleotide adenylyltransferase [Rikenellaceae bacterium]
MRIAVYSGSFDPLHIGHMAIMEYLTSEHKFDWVYLVISPQNPFKAPGKALNAQERYEAAIAAVRRHPNLHVWVDNIELTMPAPHYTIRTLDALKKREPGNEFTLVMGADNLDSIRHWRNAPKLLSEYGVIVYPRKGYDLPYIRQTLLDECRQFPVPETLDASLTHSQPGTVSLEELDRMYNISIIDAPIVDISSTEIREKQSKGIDMSQYLM